MKLIKNALASAALGLAAVSLAVPTAPAVAQIDNRDPGRFVQSLGNTGFAALKGNRAAARGRFRSLLAQHFAVDAIGDRLISRWRRQITPAQYAQYKAAFPGFIIGTYADRLYDYSNATLKVGQVQNRGASAAVASTVTKPGARPVPVIWTLTRTPQGYKVSNLTVSGVNIGLAQQADFNSYVQRNGFDALLAFMKRRG